MRTARMLTVYLPACSAREGVPGPGGCTWSQGVSGTPPCEQNDKQVQKKITLSQTSFAGGND